MAISVSPERQVRPSAWRKALLALLVVVAVALATIAIVDTQPWSKIKVLAAYNGYDRIDVSVYIDGVLRAETSLLPSSEYQLLGIWSVDAGSHLVELDVGHWYNIGGPYSPAWWYYGADKRPDIDFEYFVGEFATKNALLTI